jgi:multicomponent Na+:H+ antiporter subunit G
MSVVVIACLLGGMFFFAVGVLGILRFPDFYSRLHAAGKVDCLAVVLVVLGVAVHNVQEFNLENLLVSIKIMLIALFIYVASPTATHAITKAALVVGVVPWKKGDEKK